MVMNEKNLQHQWLEPSRYFVELNRLLVEAGVRYVILEYTYKLAAKPAPKATEYSLPRTSSPLSVRTAPKCLNARVTPAKIMMIVCATTISTGFTFCRLKK
ncbi:hypothetical protein GLAREA_05783 [Glarea lozoyensis ATCC 20868]|uniref:Uncharacterized protein n=1 Tax=Glarea lozoyensis (strain ATCC 20868 / MF5171) TaxID=1116229 RepID=S3DFA4_GLAL2|nr:uncharacterized protein GLAREA_05783 [Glarea lozoyensis ATCC 20868]EPE36445.1 hypothetical protein GLAREA_05783 [Glarea lozoyensis ATCC 20868]